MNILITAGPTREYIDDVRFLSNASSGRMGYAIAEAALKAGHSVTLISGPTHLPAPPGACVQAVETAQEMLEAALECFPACDGVIAVAAVADYRPATRLVGKLKKTDQPIHLTLVPTPDILAELSKRRTHQWLVGFALETDDLQRRAREKLLSKRLDLVVLNTPAAIGSETTQVVVYGPDPAPLAAWAGPKVDVAHRLVGLITERFSPAGPDQSRR